VLVVLSRVRYPGRQDVLKQDSCTDILGGLTTIVDSPELILNLFNVDCGNYQTSGIRLTSRTGDALVIHVVIGTATCPEVLELMPNDVLTCFSVAVPYVLVN
jgi:hypothetical protein